MTVALNSTKSWLPPNEVISKLGGTEGVTQLMWTSLRRWTEEPTRTALTLPLKKRVEQVKGDGNQSELAAVLGASASEVSQYDSRVMRMPLEKLVFHALRLDVPLAPTGGRHSSLRYAVRLVIEDLFEAVGEVRRRAGEPVSLKVSGDRIDLITALEAELLGDVNDVQGFQYREQLAKQQPVFEERLRQECAKLNQTGVTIAAEELERLVRDWSALADVVGLEAPSIVELRVEELAIAKLHRDFRGSCLYHPADWRQAEKQSREVFRVIVAKKRLRTEGRVPDDDSIVIPNPYRVGGRLPTPREVDPELRAAISPLLEHCRRNRVVVNCGAYKTACFAVLTSIRERYGLKLTVSYEDIIGGEQILRIVHEDETDFLFAPDGTFLMLGSGRARDYRRVTSIHQNEQAVMEKNGKRTSGRKRLLVVANSSPEEQLLTANVLSDAAEPVMVQGLKGLQDYLRTGVEPGDSVLAWEPLRSAMRLDESWQETTESHRIWQALYCHERWQVGSLAPLKDLMKRLLISEWQFCADNLVWAEECLLSQPDFLFCFGMGAGLA